MDLLYQRRPSLRLALDDQEADLIKGLMVWQQPHVKMRWIDAQEVHSIEPRLSPSIVGAVYEEESSPVGQLPPQPGVWAWAAELQGRQHPLSGSNRPGHQRPNDNRRQDRLRGHTLRRRGSGRRHLEPGFHALDWPSPFLSAH